MRLSAEARKRPETPQRAGQQRAVAEPLGVRRPPAGEAPAGLLAAGRRGRLARPAVRQRKYVVGRPSVPGERPWAIAETFAVAATSSRR
jgi:hypothetical protein